MSTISASTTTTTAYKVTADTTGTLVLQTGSTPTTAVTIDTAQNMGLGVTPSAWASARRAIELGGTTVGQFASASTYGAFSTNLYVDASNWRYKNNGYGMVYSQDANGSHIWYNVASGTAGNTASLTQAMTLDASSNLKVTADVYVNGTAKLSRNPLVQANNTGGQTFSAGTTTKVLFQNASVDTNTCFSSSTFTPTVAGYYLVYAQISPTANSSQEITLQLAKNGSAINRLARQSGNSLYTTYFGGTMLVYCNGSTDYIEISCFTQATFTSETPYTTFSATFVRNA